MHHSNDQIKLFWAKINPDLLSSCFLTKLWTKTWYLFRDCVTYDPSSLECFCSL